MNALEAVSTRSLTCRHRDAIRQIEAGERVLVIALEIHLGRFVSCEVCERQLNVSWQLACRSQQEGRDRARPVVNLQFASCVVDRRRRSPQTANRS